MTITEARLKAKLTQAQAAELLGISKRTYECWEQGTRKPSKQKEKMAIERFAVAEKFTAEGMQLIADGEMTWREAIAACKLEKVRELSKIGEFGDTFRANFDRIPDGIFEKLSSEDLAALVDAFRDCYNDGVTYGRGHVEE